MNATDPTQVTLPGGGGGTGPKCTGIAATVTSGGTPAFTSSITCSGNSRVNTFKLVCNNGQADIDNIFV